MLSLSKHRQEAGALSICANLRQHLRHLREISPADLADRKPQMPADRVTRAGRLRRLLQSLGINMRFAGYKQDTPLANTGKNGLALTEMVITPTVAEKSPAFHYVTLSGFCCVSLLLFLQ